MRHVIDPSIAPLLGKRFDSGVEAESTSDEHSLRQILPHARFFAGDDIKFQGVATSASTANEGDLVVYRIGQDCPGQLVADAMSRGAAGIICEQVLPCPLPQCIVGDIELAMADLTAQRLSRPDRKLLTVGVIGSAGKTTTALLVASLFRSSGIRTAYQTDLGESDGIVSSTPNEPVPCGASLVEWIDGAVDSGCRAAVVELSDHDVRHSRYEAIQFDVLIVTGSTMQDVDFGESGLQCALERLTADAVVIAPADDAKAMRVVRDSGARFVTYGVRNSADVGAKIIEQSCGMTTLLVSHENTSAVMESSLCGAAMAANHAAATMAGLLIAQPLPEIVEKLSHLREVPGRGTTLSDYGQATVVLDAAGSAQRAATALRTYRSMKSGGRLWCVLAIDPADSPEHLAHYGSLLERFADTAIVTSSRDNKAKFLSASHSVMDGVQKCAALRLVADQERALRWVIAEAKSGDTILVLGGDGGSAHRQRSDVRQITRWIESERRLNRERALSDGCDRTAEQDHVPALKIAKFRE